MSVSSLSDCGLVVRSIALWDSAGFLVRSFVRSSAADSRNRRRSRDRESSAASQAGGIRGGQIKQFYMKQFADTGAEIWHPVRDEDGVYYARGRVARKVAHYRHSAGVQDTGGSSSLHPTYAS